MKVVIMAGGKGTRISSVASDIPKPMIKVADRPILEHQISCLRAQGLCDIILIVGHFGGVIQEYFKDGKEFGVSIEYFCENEPLGTAGGLYYFKDILTSDFLLMNGDILFDIDFRKFIEFHYNKKAIASIVSHPNNHPYDSALLVTDMEKRVTRWLHKEEYREVYKNRVNAGIHILSPQILDSITEPVKTDLDRDILKPLITSGKLFAYDTPEYIKDMGTPDRYKIVCHDYLTGRITAKNLKNKQRAVFLDRDGTINKYDGFITKIEQIQLIDDVAKAIEKINSSGYLAIVISNQPVIARGDCTVEELDYIHNKIETELGKMGAYLDAIYYCPHHPDKGFKGEVEALKIDCECRKPKPGLLLQAAEDFNIDLNLSYMVGDSMIDVQAGNIAGCMSILVGKNDTLDCMQYDNILEFVTENIVNKEK